MSLVGGDFPREGSSPIPPTSLQEDYAETLVRHLFDRGEPSASEYDNAIENCESIGEMSELIDNMKEELGYD